MSRKKTWIGISLAIGLLATVAATSAGAFGGHCGRGGHRGPGGPPGLGHLEHRIERLDVSADVRTKAFAILDAARPDERALREKTRAAHEELRAMLESGAPDAKKLDAKIDELGALETKQHKQFLHTILSVGALLPADQRAEWFAPPHRGGPGDRGGRRGEHGPH
jgi:Spy/CpxP family protein refolding chaperone